MVLGRIGGRREPIAIQPRQPQRALGVAMHRSQHVAHQRLVRAHDEQVVLAREEDAGLAVLRQVAVRDHRDVGVLDLLHGRARKGLLQGEVEVQHLDAELGGRRDAGHQGPGRLAAGRVHAPDDDDLLPQHVGHDIQRERLGLSPPFPRQRGQVIGPGQLVPPARPGHVAEGRRALQTVDQMRDGEGADVGVELEPADVEVGIPRDQRRERRLGVLERVVEQHREGEVQQRDDDQHGQADPLEGLAVGGSACTSRGGAAAAGHRFPRTPNGIPHLGARPVAVVQGAGKASDCRTSPTRFFVPL